MNIKVYYNGFGKNIIMGYLTQENNGNIFFQYNKEFLDKHGNISPKELEAKLNKQGPFPNFLDYLPGIIYDSLPDGWGMLIMDRFIENNNDNNILLKLSLLNDNAIGALSFETKDDLKVTSNELPNLLGVYSIIKDFYYENKITNNNLTMLIGSSSIQGARPKLICFYQNINGDIQISNNYFSGGEPYIIKFDSDTDKDYSTILEYVYMSYAKKIWEDTPNVDLLEVKPGIYAIAIKRFDRIETKNGYQKVLMHSLAGALHTNFRFPNFSYDGFLKMTGFLTQSYTEVELAFERCVFNVIFGNKDDHTKNFSYIFTNKNKWILSPAYDLTLNDGINGHHQMDVLGKTNDITKYDLIELGVSNGIDNPEKIIEKISNLYNEMIIFIKDNYSDIIPKSVIYTLEKNLQNY